MIWNREYDYSLIRTSSKDALKRTALIAAGNDIKKASEIYDYFIKDLKDLSDFDTVPPTTMEQFKNTAMQLIEFGKEHEDQVKGVINIVMQLLGKGAQITTPPPITG